MKLKLTFQRERDHHSSDLMITVDPSTPVGDLADYLAAADPEEPTGPPGCFTLALPGPAGREIPHDTSVADARLASGAIVSLARRDGSSAEPSRDAAAVVVVLSGPDAGREFTLAVGTSVIGRGRGCDIRLTDPMTSRRHAKIHVGETVEISDLGSVNGVLVGDLPTDAAVLRPGEMAHLGDTVITVKTVRSMIETTPVVGTGGTVSFNRPPRVATNHEGRTFRLPEAPTLRKGQRFPIIPLFAPLLMGAALYITTKSTTSLIFMAMSPLMMGGNVLEGQLAGKRTYERDLDEFRAAIQSVRGQVVEATATEIRSRRSEFPSVSECARAIRNREPLLWSRRPDLPSFGQLQLGLGRQSSRAKIEFPLGRQSAPELAREIHDAFDEFETVDGVPVLAELDRNGALGIVGVDGGGRGVARSYLLQLATLHSPLELALYSICGPEQAEDWEWLKWLPHCGGTQAPLDCEPLVSARPGCIALLGALESLIQARAEAGQSPDESPLPRLVLLLDEPLESERPRLINLIERGASCGIWFVWVADVVSKLPASCKTFVEVSTPGDGVAGTGVANFVGTSETVDLSALEPIAPAAAEDLARAMAPLVDASSREDAESDVPRSVSLLTLAGLDLATTPERVIERWAENRSLLTGPYSVGRRVSGRPANLRALIGESAAGPHVLDLRVHGPHALVGGTTGAGKSEMLQSWIMGMALSNSPQRLTFLLVDYKGGSAFSDCVNLPHTVGLVTDLSPHLVRRALTSLSAELRYREHILHRKRAKDLASLERDGDPDAPPSLVIVVDEFAALVKEVPEFVDGVVNVAQRGRSLGLHLILATQRPSGVIRDNLRANTNLRIALRMADVSDSTDVIGTKVAAGFDPSIPGRAASRTGPTALIPFQTGYVGGWTSSVPERPDIIIATFGFSPKSTWEPPVDEMQTQPAEGPTDIQRLVSSIAQANRIAEVTEPRKPWMAELAHLYNLAKLPTNRRDDDLVFAVADDPGRQQQPTISFRPDDDGSMAIFGTGNSGKSTLLRTLCLAAGFTVRGGPCHVYGLDFAARGLQMLQPLPHVGNIITGTDTEGVARLFSMIRERIDERANEFATVGAGSITQYRTITGRFDEPRILLLVDGMGAMRTAYEGTENHRLYESFLGIASDGRQVGVHVIIAADRAGAIPTSLGSLIQRRVILRLAGENDYAMLGQPNDVLDSKSPPGRGMCDGLEIQVALLGDSPDVLAQDAAVRAFAESMSKAAGSAVAPPIRKLGEEIALGDLEPEIDGNPTFAMAGDTLTPRSFATEGTFTVAGPPGSGRTTTLLTLVRSVRRWRPDARLVYFGSQRSPLAGAVDWDRTAGDVADVAATAALVADLFGERDEKSSPGVVVIENLAEYIQSEADAPLQAMIKKVTANGHLIVSDGEPLPLGGLQPLVMAARASRVGLVLQPESSDGALFRTQFPRVRKSDFPPGRGLYTARGKQPVIVQVAEAGSTPH